MYQTNCDGKNVNATSDCEWTQYSLELQISRNIQPELHLTKRLYKSMDIHLHTPSCASVSHLLAVLKACWGSGCKFFFYILYVHLASYRLINLSVIIVISTYAGKFENVDILICLFVRLAVCICSIMIECQLALGQAKENFINLSLGITRCKVFAICNHIYIYIYVCVCESVCVCVCVCTEIYVRMIKIQIRGAPGVKVIVIEMDSVASVENLEIAICSCYSASIFGKNKNPTILIQAVGKW